MDSGRGLREDGLTSIQEGQALHKTVSIPPTVFHLGLIGEIYTQVGDVEAGLAVLQDAFATIAEGHEGAYEADLYRLKGELTLQKGARDWGLETSSSSSQASSLKPQVPSDVEQEAEEYFLKAIEIACRQQAKSLELRAAISLVRLRQQQVFQDASQRARAETWEKLDEAHRTLSHVYNWFTEGFDTRDLRVHAPCVLQLNECIKTINEIRLKILSDEETSEELKKEVRTKVSEIMKILDIKIPILEYRFNEVLTRLQHSDLN